MYWQIGAVANAVIAGAYFLISAAIVRGLVRTRQLRTNRLGLATATIFATCGAGHGYHLLHMMLPFFGIHAHVGLAMRQAFDWHLAVVDVVTSCVAVWYWTLRKSYGAVLNGPLLFEDLKQRQRQALEINDNVVQGLVVAKYAMDRGEHAMASEAIDGTLAKARRIISDLVGDDAVAGRLGPGDLVRERPAAVVSVKAP